MNNNIYDAPQSDVKSDLTITNEELLELGYAQKHIIYSLIVQIIGLLSLAITPFSSLPYGLLVSIIYGIYAIVKLGSALKAPILLKLILGISCIIPIINIIVLLIINFITMEKFKKHGIKIGLFGAKI